MALFGEKTPKRQEGSSAPSMNMKPGPETDGHCDSDVTKSRFEYVITLLLPTCIVTGIGIGTVACEYL